MSAATTSATIAIDGAVLEGDLVVPDGASGVVAFAHGSGSSRHSPRNREVAASLHRAGLGTLLFDLLTAEEEAEDLRTRELRFDVSLLSSRLEAAVDWLAEQQRTAGLPLGCFGASTGAAAALVAAAERPERVRAVVSRGGRPDLAAAVLGSMRAPTLLIVGGADPVVLDLNREAAAQMRCEVRLEVVEGATHLFEEPGTLDRVCELARDWFARHFSGALSVEAR
jgi:putative phosphoribosyl transferase